MSQGAGFLLPTWEIYAEFLACQLQPSPVPAL